MSDFYGYDPGFWISHAEREVFSTYGAKVSVAKKAKSLNKFGRTKNADSGVKTTVAEFQGAVVNETLATSNSIDSVISSSASDTEIVKVEGHYLDGDNNLVFTVQEATLNGQTAVTLSQALYRCTRIYVKEGTFASPASDLVGNVAGYDATAATGTTGGVPDVATATHCLIPAGENQSDKCATAISYQDYWLITGVEAGVEAGSGAGAAADVDVEFKLHGGVWRPLGIEIDVEADGATSVFRPVQPYLIIPSNADVRMVATSDKANARVAGSINGVLAIVV